MRASPAAGVSRWPLPVAGGRCRPFAPHARLDGRRRASPAPRASRRPAARDPTLPSPAGREEKLGSFWCPKPRQLFLTCQQYRSSRACPAKPYPAFGAQNLGSFSSPARRGRGPAFRPCRATPGGRPKTHNPPFRPPRPPRTDDGGVRSLVHFSAQSGSETSRSAYIPSPRGVWRSPDSSEKLTTPLFVHLQLPRCTLTRGQKLTTPVFCHFPAPRGRKGQS